MSRRFPDMRLTRDHWSAGDAIAAGVAFMGGLFGLLAAVAVPGCEVVSAVLLLAP